MIGEPQFEETKQLKQSIFLTESAMVNPRDEFEDATKRFSRSKADPIPNAELFNTPKLRQRI